MVTLTFVSIYPENSKGNRIVVDKASFTDANRANDLKFYYKRKMETLKRGYFVGTENGEELNSIFSLSKQELAILKTEGREDVNKFLKERTL